MKTIKTMTMALFVILLFAFTACSGAATTGTSDTGDTENTGGTETGSTDAQVIDTTTAATNIQSAASSLVLSVSDESASADETMPMFAIDGSSSDWDVYTDSSNVYVLTDIFGSETEEPRVVTKIRVLLDQMHGDLEGLFAQDPDLNCTGSTALTDSDNVDVAFYGSVTNGPAADRYYDCVYQNDNGTTLYGRDADQVVRVISMNSSTSANTEETATRGDSVTINSVVSVTYAERSEDSVTAAYLDLQFAHGSAYNGPDLSFDTIDDMIFKSRSRITGRVTLDSAGEPTGAAGEFTGTKYDSSATPEGERNTIVTKTMGRGNYLSDGYSIFKVDSDVTPLADLNRTFCIQSAATAGVPTETDGANCTDLETGFAWGSTTFPFDITPSLSATFDDNAFFEGNDTDMISDSFDNFTIPTY